MCVSGEGVKSLCVLGILCPWGNTETPGEKNDPKMKGGMGGNTIGGILGFISTDKDSFRIIHPP